MNTPSPWLLDPRHVDRVTAAARLATPEAHTRYMARETGPQNRQKATGGIGVLDIAGPLEHRQTFGGWLMGATPMDLIGETFVAAMNDPSVKQLLLRFDSPGGTVAGTAELAALILRHRGRKPIVASVDAMALSAGYWIASACDSVFCTPTGEVGSIGALAIHWDETAALEAAGLKPTIIRSPEGKAEFNSLEPLSPVTLEREQGIIDGIHSEFVAAVARHRGVSQQIVYRNFGQGRTLRAKEALAVGMIDGITPFADLLAGMRAGIIPKRGSAIGTSINANDDWTRAARERQQGRDAEWERAARQRNAARMDELKELTPRQPAVIRGLAIRFNEPSEPRRNPEDDYSRSREIIDPRCFDDTLNSAAEVELRFDHGQRAYARRSDFTLMLHRLQSGIYFTATIPDTPEGRHLVRQVKNGHRQMSFACTDEDAEHILHGRLGVVRHLKRAKLIEISVVERGAYPGTRCYLDRDFAPAVPVIA